MKSFNQELKNELVEEIIRHREADQIIQKTYGTEIDGVWKGCAVGCAIHSLNKKKGLCLPTNDHSVYESEFGIPRILARLEDRIFEGLSVEESKMWPENFMSAVPTNADLSLVWPKFALWLLVDEFDGVLKYAKNEKSIATIKRVAELYQREIDGQQVLRTEWKDAYDDAAADAAAYAADAAADAVDAAAATAAARKIHYGKCAAKLIEILKATK